MNRKNAIPFLLIFIILLLLRPDVSARIAAETSTPAAVLPAPGGVDNAIGFWVKADANITLAGSNVSQWDDSAGNGHSFVRETTSGPLFFDGSADPLFNFNPYLDFNGSGSRLADTDIGTLADTPNQTVLLVAQVNGVNQAYFALRNASNLQSSFYLANGKVNRDNGPGAVEYVASGSIPSNDTMLVGVRDDGGTEGEGIFNGLINLDTNLANNADSTFNAGVAKIGTSGNLHFTSNLAEIVLYETVLSDAELQRAMSYLAIKYGITLDVSGNYLDSTGAIIWNSTANATYHNDVTGIGRDDDSALVQPKSISVNSDALVMMERGAFSADTSFLLWGNNDGTTTFDVTAGQFVHMGRIWQVSEAGTVGSVVVSVPDSTNAVSLLVDDDGDFSAGATAYALTASGSDLIATVDFSDGQFFTLSETAPPAASPGGVAPNLQLWLKADAGVITSGSNVSNWNDQSGNEFNATQPTAANQPLLESSTINGNPGLLFDNLNDFLNLNQPTSYNGTNDFSVIAVIQTDGALTNPIIGPNNVNNAFAMDAYGRFRVVNSNIGTVVAGNTNVLDNIPRFGTAIRAANTFSIYVNSTLDAAPASNGISFPAAGRFIGREVRNGSDNDFYGGIIAELIVYSDALNGTSRAQVESYLAIKYGIARASLDYVDSTSNVIWSAAATSGFQNGIVGIGVDDGSGLVQLASRSVDPDSIVTITGLPAAIGSGEFLIWGHNNGATTFAGIGSVTDVSTANDRLERIWKTQETGDAGSVTVEFDSAEIQTGEAYCLLVDDDGDFTNGGTSEVGCGVDATTFSHNFTAATLYFTLGTVTVAPGGVASNLQLWLKADAGTSTTTDGADVVSWLDQSATGNDATAVNSAAFSSDPTTFNHNPNLRFDSANSEQYRIGSNIGIVGTNDFTIFSVQAVDGGNTVNAIIGPTPNHTPGVTRYEYGIQGAARHIRAGTTNIQVGATSVNDGIPHLSGGNRMGGAFSIFHAGALDVGPMSSTLVFEGVDKSIGGAFNTSNQFFDGEMAEVVVYDRALSSVERQQVDSYLAIKYGITLDSSVNYVRSDGATIWNMTTATAYNNDIAGIGVEEGSGLTQLASRSVNHDSVVTMSAPSIASENFLMWGNDDGETTLLGSGSVTGLPTVNDRLDRGWRVQGIGNVGTVTVEFESAELIVGETYCLLVDTDGDYDNGGTTEVGCSDVTGSVIAFDVAFGAAIGRYFTLGASSNTPPIAMSDSYTTTEDVPFTVTVLNGVLVNDSDAESDPLTAVLVRDVTLGTLTLEPDGAFVYTPPRDFDGVQTFTYLASDGELTSAETTVTLTVLPDHDGDTVIDTQDIDNDNDGLTDVVEGNNDSDGDGLTDNFDIDSDDDGIPDTVEAQTTLGFVAPTPGDGDGDGLLTVFDPDEGGVSVQPLNIGDNDTIPDYLDTDSDNDFAPDLFENGMGNGLSATDTDGDGLNDAFEGAILDDPYRPNDEIAAPAVDLPDSDNDVFSGGDVDYREADTFPDTDDDNIPPVVDLDDDNDGLSDEMEGFGKGFFDVDGDGIEDYLDSDSDNNGLPDTLEVGAPDANGDGIHDGWDEENPDVNLNGWADSAENNPPADPDSDSDTVPDRRDLDNLNFGLPDTYLLGFPDFDGDGIHDGWLAPNPDANGNGWLDTLEPLNRQQQTISVDADGDGVPTQFDLDGDGDGLITTQELDLTDDNLNGIPDFVENSTIDEDGNGLLDIVDPNAGGTPLQLFDSDGDGRNNLGDIDSDDDGIPDNVEAQATADYVAPSGTDANNNGWDAAYDPDENGVPLSPPNTDNAGFADWRERNSDNDLLPDGFENGLAANLPSGVDSDEDGLDDAFEGSDVDDGFDVNDEIDDPVNDLPNSDGVGEVDYRSTLPAAADDDGDLVANQIEGSGDADGDGLPNAQDFDPTGYFYEETTGVIVAGGLVEVVGAGSVTMLEDGSSGRYLFRTDGTAGTYTLTVTAPQGYALSENCVAQSDPLAPSADQPLLLRLGSGESRSNGEIVDPSCDNNPYALTFELDADDTLIVNNNIPLRSLVDFGDLPASFGVTDIREDGARHEVGELFLGAGVTVDANGGGVDSADDGITFSNDAWYAGAQVTLNITVTGGTGHLVGWLDFSRNGSFESGEMVDFGILDAGTHAVSLNVSPSFDGLSAEPLGVRFRLFPEGKSEKTVTGYAAGGEVEDYVWDVPQLRMFFPLIFTP